MKTIFNLTLALMLVATFGCGSTETASSNSNTDVTPTGKQYIASSEPANTTPVGDARQNAKDGDPVALLGHIGGTADPFVDGLAAFTIVDPQVKYCQPEEGCPTPWDYCCTQNEVKENIAMIKIVDDQGQAVSEDARQLLGVKELSLVVAEGTAQRDDQGNLSVLATRVYVKQ